MRKVIMAIMVVLALALLVSSISCKKETTATKDAEQLDAEISEYESASQAIDELDLDFNETELEQIEGLF